MNYNDKLYSMWMDCGRQEGRYMLMPCGHKISIESLRGTGGICPVCEMDKDQKELGDWPDHQAVEEMEGEVSECVCGAPGGYCDCLPGGPAHYKR